MNSIKLTQNTSYSGPYSQVKYKGASNSPQGAFPITPLTVYKWKYKYVSSCLASFDLSRNRLANVLDRFFKM